MNVLSRLPLRHLRALQLRLAVAGLLLFALIQGVSYILIQRHIEGNVYVAQRDALRDADVVLAHLQDVHTQRLTALAEVVAARTDDAQAWSRSIRTGTTALHDVAEKNALAVATYADTKFNADGASGTLLGSVLADLAQTLPSLKNDAEPFSRVVVTDWRALEVVAYPIDRQGKSGWIVLGEFIGEPWLSELKSLGRVEGALVIRPVQGEWKFMHSTLALDNAGEFRDALQPLNAEITPHGKTLRNDGGMVNFFAAELQGELYAARLINLSALQSGPSGDQVGVVALDATAPRLASFEALKLSLLLVFVLGGVLVGVTTLTTGQKLARALRGLAHWARTTIPGQYSGLPRLHGADELSELSGALDDLRKKVREREAEMLNLAYRDNLTLLPNREKFRSNLQKTVQAARQHQTPVSVLMFDLDRFKHVNDILGHSFGDRLLRMVAQRLKEEVIERDMVLARLGGDEFAVLLPGADASSAKKVAKLIHQTLVEPISLDDQTIDLSAGIGLASYPAHAQEGDALMNHCEVAMYAAKRQSSSTVIYNAKLDSGSQDSLSLLGELRQALDQGQLRLYFQPKVNLRDGSIVGAEALVRWQHPLRGMVPPTQFVPFAEQTGFVRNLTHWMIDRTAHMWRIMRKQGLTVRLSVNLSARDLLDQHLPEKIENILTKYRVHQGGMTLEITESATMDDPERALGILERLHALGLKLSIDDFGTGYSSLAYLKRLPVDELKIDKSFVMNMERDIHDAKIVRSTIDLAHNLGINVVAEGLENIQAWKLLHGLRCDEGQGYYISKPMPAEDFHRWVRQWSAPDVEDVVLSTAFAALL